MKVILAKSMGFCFGVKRAVDMVREQMDSTEKVYTFGSIVNNEEVVAEFNKHGVQTLENEADLKKVDKGVLIIRAHGIGKQLTENLQNKNMQILDATCPFVKRIHKIVAERSDTGDRIIIIGNRNHPEVQGIAGWCSNEALIIENKEEVLEFVRKYHDLKEHMYTIVAQTTLNSNKFKDLVEIIYRNDYNINIVNTICNATEERQKEAKILASSVDAMIVIGGKYSSNTEKLFEICKKECQNTYWIQNVEDLQFQLPEAVKTIGITAGASTPNNIIEEVQSYVRFNF